MFSETTDYAGNIWTTGLHFAGRWQTQLFISHCWGDKQRSLWWNSFMSVSIPAVNWINWHGGSGLGRSVLWIRMQHISSSSSSVGFIINLQQLFSAFATVKRKPNGYAMPKTVWKCLRLELGKMYLQDFRVEITAIRLNCNNTISKCLA